MNVTEKHLQNTCSEYLELDGWRRIKMDPVSDASRGKGFGELGMSDDLYLRYSEDPKGRARLFPEMTESQRLAEADVLWIEWKRAKGEPICSNCGDAKSAPRYMSKHCRQAVNGRHKYGRAAAGKASQKQLDWIAAEQARGALVLLAGVTFPATIEGFQKWYLASGLARRVR